MPYLGYGITQKQTPSGLTNENHTGTQNPNYYDMNLYYYTGMLPNASNADTTNSEISAWLQAHQNPNVPAPVYGGGSGGAGSLYSALQARFNQMAGMRKDLYDQGMAYLLDAYNRSADQLRAQNEEAQRSNYVTDKFNKRDFQQMMTAQGLTGGASESASAKMNNQYAVNQYNTNRDYGKQLAQLAAQRGENEYNLYNEYMKGLMDDYSSYYSSLASALGSRSYSNSSSYATNAAAALYSLLQSGLSGLDANNIMRNAGYTEADINYAANQLMSA